MIKITSIKPNPDNPRFIRDDKFEKLVQSIKEFPKMMALRPMVINEDKILLGGNMRYKALLELGYEEIPKAWIKEAKDLTEEEVQRFVIADNVDFGEFDWEVLTAWDKEQLDEWGLEVPAWANEAFLPELEPSTNYDDVTREEIQKEAEKLARQMLDSKELTDVICPECGATFQID